MSEKSKHTVKLHDGFVTTATVLSLGNKAVTLGFKNARGYDEELTVLLHVFEKFKADAREAQRFMLCEGGCEQNLPVEELDEDNVCDTCAEADGDV